MLSYLTSPKLSRAGVAHLFPTREGGVSEGPYASLNLGGSVGDDPARVQENLSRIAAAIGVEKSGLYSVWQMHGRDVVLVEKGTPREDVVVRNADALITRAPNAAVGVRTADCAPILLFDRDSGAVAAVHAGWRGTALDIVGAAVSAMREAFQTKPEALVAAIGPCIGPCCFEVGPEVIEIFAKSFSEDTWRGQPRPNNKGTIDLYHANELALRRAGVTEFESLRTCTYCNPGRFFSFRRDGEKSGRHLSLIRCSA